MRQVIAAHWLRDCDEIIEIGGAGLPITAFLTHRPQAVTVIDPKIEPWSAGTLNGAPCRVRHLATKFQALDLAVPSARYGLVLLGLSLKPLGRRDALGASLLAAASGAHIVVVDYALALERAAAQAPALLALPGLRMIVDVTMRIADPYLEAAGFAERRLVVLAREAAGSAEA